MVVSNPNKDKKEVGENKKTSFFGFLLGFFYNHTKGIIKTILILSVLVAFTTSFMKELEVYADMRFAMNPIEIIFIGFVDAVFNLVKYFIPFLFVCLIIKFIMIKSRKLKVEYIFNRQFKMQILIAFLLSFAFAVLFYTDVLAIATYSPQLVKSSVDIFMLSFFSILLTFTSLFGLLDGVDTVISKK